jgi:hypothetical protein
MRLSHQEELSSLAYFPILKNRVGL